MERKLLLNPNAPPFVPRAQRFAEIKFGEEHKNLAENKLHGEIFFVSKDNMDVGDTLNRQKVLATDVFSTTSNLKDGEFPDEMHSFDKQSMKDEVDANEFNSLVKFLSTSFPDISIEYLAALLSANDGDLDATIDMLLLQECGGDTPEAVDIDG